eukprot:TRINITY_DN2243_c0_g2_i2.p1 TRINITY_DN2243_c0_g2~~TRINITY_DN2243_c0_g2_i2.p1  ORF type:complete len:146 (+),score=6.51 TRINITY_DN2243_c0_g2_i2:217-654(+)
MTFSSTETGYTGITTEKLVPPFKAILQVNYHLDGVSVGFTESFMKRTQSHMINSCTCHQKAVFCSLQKDSGFYFKDKKSCSQLKNHSNPEPGVKIEIEMDSGKKCTYSINGIQEWEHILPLSFTPCLYVEVSDSRGSEIELIAII